jgi:hypothetical protein
MGVELRDDRLGDGLSDLVLVGFGGDDPLGRPKSMTAQNRAKSPRR